jgi:hypothetical protein
MNEVPAGSAEDPSTAEVNDILACLLGRLETSLAEIRSTSRGRPLLEVEADLRGKLFRTLPCARVSAEDIRQWSGEISSQSPSYQKLSPRTIPLLWPALSR